MSSCHADTPQRLGRLPAPVWSNYRRSLSRCVGTARQALGGPYPHATMPCGARSGGTAHLSQGRPRASEFVFARLRYDSGDWDYNPKVAANVLNSLVEYTNIPVYPEEVVITAGCEGAAGVSVPVHDRPQAGAVQLTTSAIGSGCSSSTAACCSPTTATTTSTASTRRASRRRCRRLSRGGQRCRSCRKEHALYRSFFTFHDGPPTTSHELNGWGDDIVHDYLRGARAPRPPRRALQQQGLRLRVGLRLAEQALPARGQHEVRGQPRRLCDDVMTA